MNATAEIKIKPRKIKAIPMILSVHPNVAKFLRADSKRFRKNINGTNGIVSKLVLWFMQTHKMTAKAQFYVGVSNKVTGRKSKL